MLRIFKARQVSAEPGVWPSCISLFTMLVGVCTKGFSSFELRRARGTLQCCAPRSGKNPRMHISYGYLFIPMYVIRFVLKGIPGASVVVGLVRKNMEVWSSVKLQGVAIEESYCRFWCFRRISKDITNSVYVIFGLMCIWFMGMGGANTRLVSSSKIAPVKSKITQFGTCCLWGAGLNNRRRINVWVLNM